MTASLTITEIEGGLDIRIQFPVSERDGIPAQLALSALDFLRTQHGDGVREEYEVVIPTADHSHN